jgi:hypothetical protein
MRWFDMKNEFVCSNCGCEDIKLVSEISKIEKKTGIFFLIMIGLVILILVIGLFLTITAIMNFPQGITEVVERMEYLDDLKYLFVIDSLAFFLSFILLLFYLLFNNKTKSSIKAVCPHCGKVWYVLDSNNSVSDNKSDKENESLEIIELKRRLEQLEKNTKF